MNRYDLSKMDTDFIGFTFNGKHSADFGILRTSDGDRYEESFVPDISDEAEAIPGGHGEYYVGETVKSKEFKIEFAYDCLNEVGLRRIRKWLHPDDQLHELIFDERPYVKYWVKCGKAVTSKGLCFEQDGDRVYKGEGTIEFIAYAPYGQEISKDLADFADKMNRDQWAEASGLIDGYKNKGLDTFTQSSTAAATQQRAEIYNPGDIESDFILEFDCEAVEKTIELTSVSSTPATIENRFKLVTDNNLTNVTYYIIYETRMCSIERQENSTMGICEIELFEQGENWEGYFDITDNYPLKFISNITGTVYDVYVSDVNNKNIPIFSCDSATGLKKRECIWVKDEIGNSRQIILLSSAMSSPQIIQFLDQDVSTKITTHDLANVTLNFALVDPDSIDNSSIPGYSMDLVFPSIGSSSPENWTETQKMVASKKWHMVIDTAKKVIKWNTNADSSSGTTIPYTGVAEIIKAGNWFKIPLDDVLEEKVNKYNNFVISHGLSTWLKISNPKLTYHYMYK